MRRRDKGARRGLLALSFVVFGAAAAAAGAQQIAPEDGAAAREYRVCMQLARDVPRTAETRAASWYAGGGGAPAMHCLSVAQLGLGQFEQAARNLEALAGDARTLRAALRADLLGQAGNAWTMAGRPEDSLRVQNAALALKPDDAGLLIDRAVTRAGTGHYWEVLDDLNRALSIRPGEVAALVFRASAWRHLGSLDLAAEDIARALAVEQENAEALLERGLIRKAEGRADAARADWLRVIELAGGGPLAEAARGNLERMDVKTR